MIIGKIILLEARSGRERATEALSYGHADEPSPELLLRRDRATLFATGDDAETALTYTFQASAKNGDPWPAKFRFKIVTVEGQHKVNAELLAALKNLIVLYQGQKQGKWGESTPPMIAARAAIAKATGATE